MSPVNNRLQSQYTEKNMSKRWEGGGGEGG